MTDDEEILPDEEKLRLMATAYFRAALEGGDPHFGALRAAFDKLFDSPPFTAPGASGQVKADGS